MGSEYLSGDRGGQTLTFVIPDVAPSPNRLRRLSYYERARVVRSYRHMAATYGRQALGPSSCPRARAHVTITLGKRRRMDSDNAMASLKPIIDGLRDAHLLVDDNLEWLDLRVDQEKIPAAAQESTTITVSFPEHNGVV